MDDEGRECEDDTPSNCYGERLGCRAVDGFPVWGQVRFFIHPAINVIWANCSIVFDVALLVSALQVGHTSCSLSGGFSVVMGVVFFDHFHNAIDRFFAEAGIAPEKTPQVELVEGGHHVDARFPELPAPGLGV